ncbi:MAG: type II secretion system protein GspG [Myxococcaceae bacterium]
MGSRVDGSPSSLCVTGSLLLSREHEVERRIARQDLAVIQRALQSYRVESAHWPSESSWRENLVAAKLLERPPVDPWGHAYRFRVERPDAGVERPSVVTDGPDGVAETADDLRSGP